MSTSQGFLFGLVADIQYACKENGGTEGRVQRYGDVPQRLAQAVQCWHRDFPKLYFVLSLGDIIDGRDSQVETDKDFSYIKNILRPVVSTIGFYHVLGNHCLRIPRDRLIHELKMPGSYYSKHLPHHWRLLVLDTTEMSGHSGFPQVHCVLLCDQIVTTYSITQHRAGSLLLFLSRGSDHNHTQGGQGSALVQEAAAFKAEHPMSPAEPQMADWNGGVGSHQLAWLKEQLADAIRTQERVIVACHHQIGKGAARDTHLAWNWVLLQQVLLESPWVRLVLSGHDHMGGYAQHGDVHFVTVEAMLEAPLNTDAYAIVEVTQDCINIQGKGSVTSRQLKV